MLRQPCKYVSCETGYPDYDTGMLDRTVREQEFASNSADFLPLSMFEQKRSGWNFNWAGIVLVVVFVLAVVWVFRQNPPGAPADAAEKKVMWTSGKIVEGPLEVEAKSYLSFPLNLNKR